MRHFLPWVSLTALVMLPAAACSSDDDGAAPEPSGHIAIFLERDDASQPNPVRVTVQLTDAAGNPDLGKSITVEAEGGDAGSVVEDGEGLYSAVVVPAVAGGATGEVRIVATSGARRAEAWAVVLPQIDSTWGQPERVPGLVNTDGTEDSPEVSPDGNWLIVSTYSPVDLQCCLAGAALPGCSGEPRAVSNPACSASLGPYAGPERPDMLGASRIRSATEIDHTAPRVGITTAGDAVPPTAAYGFRRQEDGSFGDPFVIGLDMDGFTYAPFGFSFVGTPTQAEPPEPQRAALLFSFLPLQAPQNYSDLFFVEATLGEKILLGSYSAPSGQPVTDDFLPLTLPLNPLEQHQSNPSFGGRQVWFDSEVAADEERDLFFATTAGTLPDTALAPTARVGVSAPGVAEYQPYFDAPSTRLFFSKNFNAVVSSHYEGGDPAKSASWSEVRTELSVGGLVGGVGAVSSIGEPSLARLDDGSEWLYFAYYVRRDGRYDGSIGRVRRRPE
ncbi:Ig-like domain-containing protein [Chondromyces apiculatus]|uniref:Big-1 domain-containing protein n=1 Tax=Chondromyces apiculatus DSM 436 TaxID=1192034 RepID=A0A017TCM0_9BACT|nr:Ig-like domain-containing protein [Chondromyces apiculatus]EYF06381.1 Hypothetical protein CAP_1911 [Chondromyces apiculatus DSM 436]